MHGWFTDEATSEALRELVDAGVVPDRPVVRDAGESRRGRTARRQDGRRDRLARGVQPRGGGGRGAGRRRQAGGLGIEEDGLPRRPGPAPDRSSRRPTELGVTVLDEDGFRRLLAGELPRPTMPTPSRGGDDVNDAETQLAGRLAEDLERVLGTGIFVAGPRDRRATARSRSPSRCLVDGRSREIHAEGETAIDADVQRHPGGRRAAACPPPSGRWSGPAEVLTRGDDASSQGKGHAALALG